MNSQSFQDKYGDNLIYGLRDPRTDEYKYIGKSNVGIQRPKSHLTFSHNQSVNVWVEELRSVGLAPLIDVLEECYENELVEKEKFWIQYYEKTGCKLFNSIMYYGHAVDLLNKEVQSEKERLENILNGIVEEMEQVSTLGGFIRRKRRESKMDQEELAKRCNITARTLRTIELNSGNTSLDTINKVLDVFGYTLLPVHKKPASEVVRELHDHIPQ